MGLSFGHCGVTAWISVKRVNKRHSTFGDIICNCQQKRAQSRPNDAPTADKFARRHGTRIYLLNTKIAPAKPLGIVDHTMIHGSKIRAELSPRTTRKDEEAEIQGIRSVRPTRKPSQSARVSVAYPRRLAERKYSAS